MDGWAQIRIIGFDIGMLCSQLVEADFAFADIIGYLRLQKIAFEIEAHEATAEIT